MLWVQDTGQGSPVALLHAVGTSGGIWWQHIPRLARRFRVLAVDLPGHGQSPKPKEPVSLEGMANALHEALQNRSLLPAHLVGLSLGGMVAQMMAVQYPESVATLTLCDTICEVNPAGAEILEERAQTVEKEGMAATVKPTLERWFAPGFAAGHSEVVATVEKLLRDADPIINAQTWRAIAKLNLVSRLSSLPHIPTLVINGSLDTSIAPDAGRRLCDFFNGHLGELSGCAHMAPLEAPDKFLDIVEPFLLANAPEVKPGS